jgi:DNA-binding NarL/FixJ family response regulator
VTSSAIRLLIVDDHPVVRDGLTGMFAAAPEFEVVGQAGDGAEAVRLAGALGPDVILMDLRMPGMDGVAAITELGRQGSAARVLVLTTYDTDSYVLPAIEAGATGYLLKDAPSDDLLRAVRAAARGDAVLAPSVAARLMSRIREPAAAAGAGDDPGTGGSGTGAGTGSGARAGAGTAAGNAPGTGGALAEPLSQRELEILELVATGTTNREAAARLFISEATVKTHLLHIYAKLGVNDRAAAVAVGFSHGLLRPR